MPVELVMPTERDIFLAEFPLPLQKTLFPLGFPLELSTNSDAVISAAQQSWDAFPALFSEPPVRLSLAVTEHEDERLPARPKFRTHLHLMSIVSDAQNQVVCDFDNGLATGWITRRVAQASGFLRLHFLESSVSTLLVTAHLAPIHGALVTRRGVGVALCGDSFAGKSTLAYACARNGWTFICDDGAFLLRDRGERYAVGNPYRMRFRDDAAFLFPELRNFRVARRHNGALGIEAMTGDLPITTAQGCSIDNLVFLRRSRAGRARIERFDSSEALRWLERATLFGPHELQESQRHAYRTLLDAGIWELHYSDLSEAVQVLEQFGGAR